MDGRLDDVSDLLLCRLATSSVGGALRLSAKVSSGTEPPSCLPSSLAILPAASIRKTNKSGVTVRSALRPDGLKKYMAQRSDGHPEAGRLVQVSFKNNTSSARWKPVKGDKNAHNEPGQGQGASSNY